MLEHREQSQVSEFGQEKKACPDEMNPTGMKIRPENNIKSDANREADTENNGAGGEIGDVNTEPRLTLEILDGSWFSRLVLGERRRADIRFATAPPA